MNSKYVLTYDLKILYCSDVQLSSTCKELNLSHLQFTQYDGSIKEMDDGYTLYTDEVTDIVKNILMGKVGYELSKKDMDWLMKYEEKLKENVSILLNKKVTYNYFILKFKLLGFSESMAKDIVYTYYSKMEHGRNVPHQQILLQNINRLMKEKILWVKNDLDSERNKEEVLLTKIVNAKLEKGYTFSFEHDFKREYLKLCESGIVNALMIYNQKPSFLVRKKHDPTDLVGHILNIYLKEIETILIRIYRRKYLMPNDAFIQNLLKQIESVAKLYITINFTKKV